MHARVIRATVPEGGMDRGLESIRSITIPAVKNLPGNKGGYWFVDRGAGRVIGTVFFESQAALDDSRDAAAKLREESMSQGGAQLAGVEEYEVVVDTGQKVSTTAKFGRLTFTKGDPSTVDPGIEQVKSRVKPAVEGMQGFAGAVWLADRAAGSTIGITLWDSEEALKNSAQQVSELRESAVQAAGTAVVGVEECEIGARAETT